MRIFFLFFLFLLPLEFLPQCNVIIQPGSVQKIDVNPGIKFSFTIQNNSSSPYQTGTFHMSFGWMDNPMNPAPAWQFTLNQQILPGGSLNVTTPVFDVPVPSNATQWPFWDDLTGPNGWPNSNYGPLLLYLNGCFLNSATVNSFLPLSDDCPNINGDQFCDCDVEVYDFRTTPEMEIDLIIKSDYNCFPAGYPPGTTSFNLNNPYINNITIGIAALPEDNCTAAGFGFNFLHFSSQQIPNYVLGDTITLQLDQASNWSVYNCLIEAFQNGVFNNCYHAALWQINNSFNFLSALSPDVTPNDNFIMVDSGCGIVNNTTDLSINLFEYDILGCDVGAPYAQMEITVMNSGNTVINNFCLNLDILPDGLPPSQYCFQNLNLLPGQNYVVNVNGAPLANGVTSMFITMMDDAVLSNNSLIGIINLPCYGCTLTSAFNYNPYATVDDGSCIPIILGCTDPTANNFDPNANTDDGSCTYTVLGCTDPTANNFDPGANTDDGSCTYTVLGCTDPTANNFDPNANTDDGSCTYTVLGCTDPTALNYNYLANQDDGSCVYDPCEGFLGDLYFAPNAVTPNNDGVNDGWAVVTDPDCWINWHVFIYNRWGEMVWESRIPGQVWNGQVRDGNHYVADGVYYYIIRGQGYKPEASFERSGHITVLR